MTIKDIRSIDAIFIQSMIYTIYLTGISICAAHQYSVNYIPSQNIVYKLQESSDYRQTWVTEANFPDIVLYGHTYPQHRFLHEKVGTQHHFRIIHGVLESYDVVNQDIEAVFSKK